MKSLRQLGWDFVHNRRAFAADVLGPIGMLPLKWSEWCQDCIEIYSKLDVKGRHVLDIGSDFGTTPMYFIQRGAIEVFGISLEPQYFFHPRYEHVRIQKEGKWEIFDNDQKIRNIALKSDAEGIEWEFTSNFIRQFRDWIIALHYPIGNPELYEWIKAHGELIATKDTEEFAVYQKRK